MQVFYVTSWSHLPCLHVFACITLVSRSWLRNYERVIFSRLSEVFAKYNDDRYARIHMWVRETSPVRVWIRSTWNAVKRRSRGEEQLRMLVIECVLRTYIFIYLSCCSSSSSSIINVTRQFSQIPSPRTVVREMLKNIYSKQRTANGRNKTTTAIVYCRNETII